MSAPHEWTVSDLVNEVERVNKVNIDLAAALKECITDEDAPGMQPGLGRQRRRFLAINRIAAVALEKGGFTI
jgi:hypothetical protein